MRIDAVQLPEIDPVELEPLEAVIDALLQILGLAVRYPLVRPGPGVAAFRSDDQTFWIGMERFGDEQFAGLGAVGVGSIDKIHAELDHALQDAFRFFAIFRPTPDAVTGDAHRAESEPVHFKIAADLKGAAGVRFGSKQIANAHHRQSYSAGQTQLYKIPSIH